MFEVKGRDWGTSSTKTAVIRKRKRKETPNHIIGKLGRVLIVTGPLEHFFQMATYLAMTDVN